MMRGKEGKAIRAKNICEGNADKTTKLIKERQSTERKFRNKFTSMD